MSKGLLRQGVAARRVDVPNPARIRVTAIVSAVLLGSGVVAAQPRDQQARPAPGQHRVAFVNVGPAAPNTANLAALRAGLAALGYVEGHNLVLDVRFADGRVDRLPDLVNELLALRPQVILSTGGAVTARAVKEATTQVPVVFITGDPVVEGLVATLARPGGNLTGLAVLASDLEAKRLEILTQVLPTARRVAIIWNPAQPSIAAAMDNVELAGKRLGLTLMPRTARNRVELDAALADVTKQRADALFVMADPVLGFERARIVEFAAAQRLPSVYFWREFAEIGGLASYGTKLTAMYARTATYVDRIFKGATPANMPVEQPTTFELVLNLRTARSLGIVIPGILRQIADELIE